MLKLHTIERTPPRSRARFGEADIDIGCQGIVTISGGGVIWVAAVKTGSPISVYPGCRYLHTFGPRLVDLSKGDLTAARSHGLFYRYLLAKMYEAGLSYSEIARASGSDVKTIKKWVTNPVALNLVLAS